MISPQPPPDGIKGLAMMAPIVGLPLLLHAVGGAVVTGAGFAAVSSVMSPIAEKLLQVTNVVASGHGQRPIIGTTVSELPVSVPISVTVVDKLPAGNEDRIPVAAEVII